jgi:hypothetical protein
MGGWIKMEKDLLTDPRLLRIARWIEDDLQIEKTDTANKAWGCNAWPLPGVTVLLGALARIWMVADTHVGEDNVLALGIDEIDELVGLPGLCELLPIEWLQVIDSDHVKLPNFHAHNGTVAKETALTARRVTRYRNKKQRKGVTGSNGQALPDRDLSQDLDHTKTSEDIEHAVRAKTASRLAEDFGMNPERRAVAQAEGIDADRELARFCDHWKAAGGATARKRDWDAAWRNWCRKAADMKPPAIARQPKCQHGLEAAMCVYCREQRYAKPE